jgi:hypothetical protein
MTQMLATGGQVSLELSLEFVDLVHPLLELGVCRVLAGAPHGPAQNLRAACYRTRRGAARPIRRITSARTGGGDRMFSAALGARGCPAGGAVQPGQLAGGGGVFGGLVVAPPPGEPIEQLLVGQPARVQKAANASSK